MAGEGVRAGASTGSEALESSWILLTRLRVAEGRFKPAEETREKSQRGCCGVEEVDPGIDGVVLAVQSRRSSR